MSQHLDTQCQPHELHLHVAADRGERFECPECGAACPAHEFTEKRWRHLNFFQHHCYITAAVPRVRCSDHGIRLVDVPWARKGSAFTPLFEQAALALVREMPVLAVTVDWFHIVQVFTRSVDEVRKLEGKEKPLPTHLRWTVLKRGQLGHLTDNQLLALAEIVDQGLDTATRTPSSASFT